MEYWWILHFTDRRPKKKTMREERNETFKSTKHDGHERYTENPQRDCTSWTKKFSRQLTGGNRTDQLGPSRKRRVRICRYI